MNSIALGLYGIVLIGLGSIYFLSPATLIATPWLSSIIIGAVTLGVILVVYGLVKAGKVSKDVGIQQTTTTILTPQGPALITQTTLAPQVIATPQGNKVFLPPLIETRPVVTPLPVFTPAPPAPPGPVTTTISTTPTTITTTVITPQQSSIDIDFQKYLQETGDPFAISIPPNMPEPPAPIIPIIPPTISSKPTQKPAKISPPISQTIITPSSTVAPSVTGSKMTQAEANEMLSEHNKRRAEVGQSSVSRHMPVPSPALPPLEWDVELAQYAQNWSDEMMKIGGDDIMAGTIHSKMVLPTGVKVGENISASGGNERSMTNQVNGWYDEEIDDYDYANNTCAPDKVCDHARAILWRNTTKIGCGYSEKGQTRYYSCNFLKPGNMNRQKPY